MPKDKISYRVYQQTRVKHKIYLLNEEVYPVYITVNYGKKALNVKSRIMEQAMQRMWYDHKPPRSLSVEHIMQQEAQVVGFIVNSPAPSFSPALFREQYGYYTTDVLHGLEQQVKQFLVQFFNGEGMPSIAHLISHTKQHIPVEVIIDDLQKLLSEALLQKLLNDRFFRWNPYIPLKRFYESVAAHDMPLLTAFHFYQPHFCHVLTSFMLNEYPQFAGFDFIECIHSINKDSKMPLTT